MHKGHYCNLLHYFNCHCNKTIPVHDTHSPTMFQQLPRQIPTTSVQRTIKEETMKFIHVQAIFLDVVPSLAFSCCHYLIQPLLILLTFFLHQHAISCTSLKETVFNYFLSIWFVIGYFFEYNKDREMNNNFIIVQTVYILFQEDICFLSWLHSNQRKQ